MDPDDILPLRKVSLRVAPNQRKLCFKSIGGPPGWIDGLGLDDVIPNAKDRYFVLSSILLEFNYIVSWFAYPDPKDKMKFRLHTFSSLVAATCKRLEQSEHVLHDASLLKQSPTTVEETLHRMHRYGMLKKKRLEGLLPCVNPCDMTHGYTLDLAKYKPLYIEAPSADRIWRQGSKMIETAT